MEFCFVCGAKSVGTTKCPFCGSEALRSSGEDISKDAIEHVLRSVVSIKTSFSLGTGFVIDNGFVITNAHCITYHDKKGKIYVASSIYAEFNEKFDKNSYVLQILRYDISEDIAILTFKNKPQGIKTISLGDASNLKMGDKVFTIGCPMGYDFSYMDGSISNPSRVVDHKKNPVIQTNIALNNGSSGGPLCTSNGIVVGITTFNEVYVTNGKEVPVIKKIDGISFAISEKAIKQLVAKIIMGGI